jgi:hypothetical protein
LLLSFQLSALSYQFLWLSGLVKGRTIKSSLARLDAIKGQPSAAKTTCIEGSNGMAEAMPLQSCAGTNLVRVFLIEQRTEN